MIPPKAYLMIESQSQTPLAGKVALVTGAGRGIGRAIARGYAAAGAAVGCVARSVDEVEQVAGEINAGGGQALAAACDVRDFDAVTAATAAVVAAFGRLDIVVISAGVNLVMASIADSDPAAWAQTVDINLTGAYHCIKAALPYLRPQGGHILTIGSGRGHRADPDRSAYAASKAGLALLTRAAAEELWTERICVNELVPGPVVTAMQQQSVAQHSANLHYDREWVKPPEAVVPLAVWIVASDPATGPTGQCFSLMRRDVQ